eukprot:jgi/Astpho2/6564/fgenesh1_pg.00100_%23_1_t
MNATLNGIQQRNLGADLGLSVMYRRRLIIGIFAERACTREARLQMGFGNVAAGSVGAAAQPQEAWEAQQGPVRRMRELQQASSRRAGNAVVAVVGYTNVGNSLLTQALSKRDMGVQVKFIATLDPPLRRVMLPSGREVLLSDTVGFITDLPPQLIKAFKVLASLGVSQSFVRDLLEVWNKTDLLQEPVGAQSHSVQISLLCATREFADVAARM